MSQSKSTSPTDSNSDSDDLSDLPISSTKSNGRKGPRTTIRVPAGKHQKAPTKAPKQFKEITSLSQYIPQQSSGESPPREPSPDLPMDEAPDDECPMCGEIVDISTLQFFKETCGRARPTIRQQQKFCKDHQQSDAEQLWKDRGYPSIDWETLYERMDKYHGNMKRLLEKPQESHFRREMEKRERDGRSRTLMQHMKNEGFEGISLGYYGTRGLGLM